MKFRVNKANRFERILASKNYNGSSFQNLNTQLTTVQWHIDVINFSKLYLKTTTDRYPSSAIPVFNPKEVWNRKKETNLRVTWLGHSTVLIELSNKIILTDPVFAQRASPLSYIGPKRFHPTPVKLNELPKIDFILISHDHFDHLCAETITKFAALNIPIITSLGVGSILEKYGVKSSNIFELDWHEEVVVDGIKFISVPSQHFSGRGVLFKNQTLWSSWVMQDEFNKLFFSGDTGFHNEFVDIKNKYGPFDLIFLEIGAYHPLWSDVHLGPENAFKAFELLGGGTLIPIHWGTFNLSIHAWNEPAETLYNLAKIYKKRVIFPLVGEPFEINQYHESQTWWRL